MKTVAITLRSMQFFAHAAHQQASGKTFMQDHAFFGSAYAEYEDAYDKVVERMIGLGQEVDPSAITTDASKIAAAKKADNPDESYQTLLDSEKHLCKLIAVEARKASDGTQNMLQGLADDSEVRQYKMRQRLL